MVTGGFSGTGTSYRVRHATAVTETGPRELDPVPATYHRVGGWDFYYAFSFWTDKTSRQFSYGHILGCDKVVERRRARRRSW